MSEKEKIMKQVCPLYRVQFRYTLAQEKREIAKAMKEAGAEKEYIAKVTGLTREEVEML